MSQLDWNAEAEHMAERAASELVGRARAVLPGRQSRVSVVVGNDAGTDPAAVQDAVKRIQDDLAEASIRVLGFAEAPGLDGTWAMIVESEDLPMLEELVGADGS